MAPPSLPQTLFSDLGVAAAVLQWGTEGDKKAGPVDASQFFPSTEIIFEVVVVERESSICMAAFFLPLSASFNRRRVANINSSGMLMLWTGLPDCLLLGREWCCLMLPCKSCPLKIMILMFVFLND